MCSNYGQKSLLVAVQSGKGHICFTKPFLLARLPRLARLVS